MFMTEVDCLFGNISQYPVANQALANNVPDRQNAGMSTTNRIKEVRTRRGLTVEDLAEAIGRSPSYVSRIENGKRPLTTRLLDDFATALDVRPTALLDDQPSLPPLKPEASERALQQIPAANVDDFRKILDQLGPLLNNANNLTAEMNRLRLEADAVKDESSWSDDVKHVPLISWVSAGKLDAPATVSEILSAPRIPVSGLGNGDWIALQVIGDSMNLIAPDGSTIVVNRNDQNLSPNGYYVVATEEGEATFKRFRSAPPRFVPYSTNPEHEDYYPDGAVKVIGRVRKCITDI